MKQNDQQSLWKNILQVRSNTRIRSLDIIHRLFHSFCELHGDRNYGDDKSMITGLAFFHNIPVTVIAQYRGRTESEKQCRQYGMTLPEGYRKSLRVMRQAEKFNRPIICFIDTPGAFPGIGAEQRGQAEAIARNLSVMSSLKVPIISVIIGEGGSGGALALGIANRIIMLEKAIYSVVSPEGCASILWKTSSYAPEAATHLKLTAQDLYEFKIIDQIIEEDGRTDHISLLDQAIYHYIKELKKMDNSEIVSQRRLRYRNIGRPTLKQEVSYADKEII